ncbi:ABC transporter substrate-binding protein [Aquitalea sp. LB_tupeE]|uniref:substrate-binding periplasmic protein n=1 Tax=Aquitalea sp. LB_tupeE TaxID=2748078 RepID=UPI0015BD4D6B|nr:ABC transporter substrate-binding protein [Aquitalea sp. LB_tupeE]NWK79640.1 transporter substrate-binding domain-containing protein [Aquitalea sp. LB_tupeE]
MVRLNTFNKYLLLLCLFFMRHAGAEELLIFGSDQFAPVSYMEGGEQKGIFPELLRRISMVTGDKYVIKLYPWKRAIHLAEVGAGGVANISWNSKRADNFDYSMPFYQANVVLVVKKGKEFDYHRVDDLYGKVIGAGAGSSYRDEIDNAIASGKITIDRDPDQLSRMRKLLAGRVDAILVGTGKQGVDYVLSKYMNGQIDKSSVSILPQPVVIDPLHVAFLKSMQKKAALNRMNNAYMQLLNNGKLDDLLTQ